MRYCYKTTLSVDNNISRYLSGEKQEHIYEVTELSFGNSSVLNIRTDVLNSFDMQHRVGSFDIEIIEFSYVSAINSVTISETVNVYNMLIFY